LLNYVEASLPKILTNKKFLSARASPTPLSLVHWRFTEGKQTYVKSVICVIV